MRDFFQFVGPILNTALFRIGDTPITLVTLLSIAVIVFATFWVSRLLRRIAEKTLSRRGDRPGAVGTVTGLIHYTILMLGFGVALDTVGIDLTALFAAGAIFAIGLGFAMQSIAQNFVAGVILLAERTIKPGDILQVEGRIVKVVEMGIRASIAHTRDGEDLIIPNSTLIQTVVTNYTLRSRAFRVRVSVGVLYASDMQHVRQTLEHVAAELSGASVVADRAPRVFMTGFGDNSVNWEVAVWIDDPWELRGAMSRVHEAMWAGLQREGIVIAFPQLDVHFDPPVVDSFERVASGRVA